MNKVTFLNELVGLTGQVKEDTDNFNIGMGFDFIINIYYEVLNVLQTRYNIYDKILITPVDFACFISDADGGYNFLFKLADGVPSGIDCSIPIELPIGKCIIRENENEAGYIAHIIPNQMQIFQKPQGEYK
jgi:hypothetical protein